MWERFKKWALAEKPNVGGDEPIKDPKPAIPEERYYGPVSSNYATAASIGLLVHSAVF